MKKYFKILQVNVADITHEEGKYPINEIIPFGPPFESKSIAKHWLKTHAAMATEYFIVSFYSLKSPDNLQSEGKNDPKEKNRTGKRS
jgi:hypothetical protein